MNMDESEILNKIEHYLEGRMSKEEHSSFESNIQTSPELRSMVDHVLLSKASAYQHGRTLLKRELLDDWEQVSDSHNSILHKRYIPIAIAASIIILIGIRFLFFPNEAVNQNSFEAYYSLPDVPVHRNQDSARLKLTEAHLLFQEQKFDTAYAIYQELMSKDSLSSEEIRFYLGFCQLELGQTDLAIQSWAQLNGNEYRDAGKWYTALAWLRLGNKNEASHYAHQLLETENIYYHDLASKLLEDIAK